MPENTDSLDSDSGWDMTAGKAELELVAPPAGSVHLRDYVGRTGALTALVGLEVRVAGPVERIDFVMPDGEILGQAGKDRVLWAEIARDGEVAIEARAYGAGGKMMASDVLNIEIQAPQAQSCYDWLDLYGVEYVRGPAKDGPPDPVTVTTPINGLEYRYTALDNPRQTFFMDCSLAASLAHAAHHLRKRDVIEVADIGVYNYRCIGNKGTPPDCRLSQHAYARGLDIGGLTTGDGTYYSVRTDWVIDDEGMSTCESPTENEADAFLHQVICDLKNAGVWNIVLTPNYNDAHRDHFHVDLTPGADYIKLRGDDGPADQQPPMPAHADVDEGPDLH